MSFVFEPLPDHPQIRSAERTGYPTWHKEPEPVYCHSCGGEITEQKKYADQEYAVLCADCLLMLHELEDY